MDIPRVQRSVRVSIKRLNLTIIFPVLEFSLTLPLIFNPPFLKGPQNWYYTLIIGIFGSSGGFSTDHLPPDVSEVVFQKTERWTT